MLEQHCDAVSTSSRKQALLTFKVGSQGVMPKLLHDATKCLLQAGIPDLPCWLGCQQALKKFAELVHVPWHLSLLWLQVLVLVQVECLLLSQ